MDFVDALREICLGTVVQSFDRDVTTVKEWKNKESGLKCKVVLHKWGVNNHGKHYCGYVYLDKPEWMSRWDIDDFNEFISVHGGITWCDSFEGEDFCIGFDTMHGCDFETGFDSIWNEEMAICETNHMAIQVGRLLEDYDGQEIHN